MSVYGETIREDFVAKDSDSPIRIAIIHHREALWLDIRRMWYGKDGSMKYGKGVRLAVEGDVAQDVTLVASSMLAQYLLSQNPEG